MPPFELAKKTDQNAGASPGIRILSREDNVPEYEKQRMLVVCGGFRRSEFAVRGLWRIRRALLDRTAQRYPQVVDLLHAGAEGLVFIFLAVPENNRGCLIAAALLGEDSHHRFLFPDGHLFHEDLFEG